MGSTIDRFILLVDDSNKGQEALGDAFEHSLMGMLPTTLIAPSNGEWLKLDMAYLRRRDVVKHGNMTADNIHRIIHTNITD